MTRLLRPSFWLPVLLSVALIVALLVFGNGAAVLDMLRSFRLRYLIIIAVLVVAYEVVQYLQWHALIMALGVNVPRRAQVFAYLLGDATKMLPIGNFVDNILLQRSQGTDFGLTSAASLMSVLIEVAVTLVGLAILGIKHWDWLRPVIIVGLAIFSASVWVLWRIHFSIRLPSWLAERPSVGKALAELRQFREGTVELVRPPILVHAGLLGALYVLIGGTTLYFVVRGLGVTNISYVDVLAVYFFSIAFSLIFPLPVDIGVSEASGVGAFLAYGVDKSAAVGAVLILRAVTTGGSIIIALLALIFMRDQVRLVLHEQTSQSPPDEQMQSAQPE